jgi:hypothetical protein
MIEHLKSVGARAQWLSRDLGQQWRTDPQTKTPYALQSKQEWNGFAKQFIKQSKRTKKKKKNCNCPD